MRCPATLLALLALGALACGNGSQAGDTPSDRRPNVVLIMADDLGAETLACYGNTVFATPRIDRLAAEGARFANAFATPVCTPTRAMILTGLHPGRTGFLERLDSPLDPQKTNRLPIHLATLGQVFQAAGYATAIAGKWHLGDFQKYPDQPASHGFDQYSMWVQYWDGERRSRYFAPHVWEDGEYAVHPREVFGPDHFSDFLLNFMEANMDRPFLAYYPMNLVHTPFVHPPEIEADAEANYPNDLGESERIFGRMITYMDAVVGRFVDKIERLGISNDTLIVFTGDNGTSVAIESRLGSLRVRGGKRTMNEAGTRVPLVARWPGTIPAGTRHDFFSLVDVLPTLCALAGVPLGRDVDGMNLASSILGQPGPRREHFPMSFEGDLHFVRDERFRLHEDGRMYDVPVASDRARYSMDSLVSPNDHLEARMALQSRLNALRSITKTDETYAVIPYGTGGDRYKNAQDAAAR